MRKFAVVTTYNQQGLDRYAQRFINTFDKNMPREVDLLLYSERARPALPKTKRHIKDYDAEKEMRNTLVEFKKKYKYDLRANGKGPDGRRLDANKAFKWDAIRFSHKVYAIFDAVKKTDADVLIWMDADSVVHTPMPMEFLQEFIPDDKFLCYAGRKNKYTECGWYSMNLRHPHADKFFEEFQRMYDDAENGIFTLKEWHDSYVFDVVREWHTQNLRHPHADKFFEEFQRMYDDAENGIFTLKEWHDSYVFDVVREWHTQEWGAVNKDFSNGLIEKEGHPIINSDLGKYIDHLKGDRKAQGHSNKKDLKIDRQEDYWRNIR